MALRVQGIGDVERDFKRAGDAGERSFSRIERAANGAARQVSDYHARLKRVAQQARADVANLPEFHKGDALTAARGRNQFVLDRIDAEKSRIRAGLPDMTLPGAAEGAANAGLLARGLGAVGGAAGVATIALTGLTGVIGTSVVAYSEHERALDKFNATLTFSGNLSGASSRQIEQMAKRVVDATMQTEEAALSAAASLARVPFITAEMLDQALQSSARFADAMGTDVVETAERTGTVLTAIAKNDVKALAESLDGLSGAAAMNVVELTRAGKVAEAQKAYLQGMADAAGDGPNGAARAADRLSDSWNRMKAEIGSLTAGPVVAVMDAISWSMEKARENAGLLAAALRFAVTRSVDVRIGGGPPTAQDPLPDSVSTLPRRALGAFASAQDLMWQRQREAILNPDKPDRQKRTRSGGGGRGGKSDAEREAERLAREAETARKAADRVREANDDVVASYRQRADEAAARLGLEGAALEAVERKQEIDAAVRRLQVDLIEKEVAARRAAAAAARKPFDEAAATTEATAALAAQTDELRRHAAALYDDEQAQKDFLAQQERAAALFEATRTPLELMKREVASLVDLLRAGTITADVFDRRMQQIAEDMVDAAERGRNAWQGFGADVATSLRDIALNGGSAMDVLRQLLAITAGRLFDQNIGLPLADAIDGVTGNNRDRNIASARSALPQASDIAAGSVANLGANADLAASALGRLAIGDPLAPLTGEADASAAALRGVTAGAGQFGTTLASIIASLSGGGGGGGGLLGLALNLGAAALSGGSAAGISNGGAAVKALGKTPGFAGGGYPPIGMPFDVGENGKERMMLLPGGGARVFSGDQTRRMAANDGGPPAITNYFTIPERADPRRTATTVSRAVQGGIQRASTKGLAAGPRRVRP